MELHDAAAAQRLHSLRVGEAVATGSAPDPRRLPDRPSRGIVLGVVLAVIVTLLVGVVGVMVGAFADGDPMSAPSPRLVIDRLGA